VTSAFLPLTRHFGVLVLPLVFSLPALVCALIVHRYLPETLHADTRVIQRQLMYGRRRPLVEETIDNPKLVARARVTVRCSYAGYGALNGDGDKRESLMAFNWSDTDSARSHDDQTTRLLF